MTPPPPTCVYNKTLIHQVRSRYEEEVRQGIEMLETRGDVLIQGLWENYTDVRINVKFGDADADTYNHELRDKIMDFWEKYNKYMHSKQ